MPQQRSIATRRKILLAAGEIFGRLGYAATTIEAILGEAGITRGALYFHFASKEALAQAVVDAQEGWRSDQAGLAGSPVQQVITLSYQFARALQEDPLMRGSVRLTLETATFGAHEASVYVGWLQAVTGLLEQADAQGLLLPGTRPADLAYVLASAFTGAQLFSEALSGRSDILERARDLWQIVLPGMVPKRVLGRLDIAPPAQPRPAVTS